MLLRFYKSILIVLNMYGFVFCFDPYSVLGVKQSSSLDEVKKAYYKLVLEKHPDISGSHKDFSKIKDAYEQIRNTQNPRTQSVKGFANMHPEDNWERSKRSFGDWRDGFKYTQNRADFINWWKQTSVDHKKVFFHEYTKHYGVYKALGLFPLTLQLKVGGLSALAVTVPIVVPYMIYKTCEDIHQRSDSAGFYEYALSRLGFLHSAYVLTLKKSAISPLFRVPCRMYTGIAKYFILSRVGAQLDSIVQKNKELKSISMDESEIFNIS